MSRNEPGGRYWGRLYTDFPDFQVALVDGDELLAEAHAIPVPWDGTLDDLRSGWDEGFERGMTSSRARTALMAIAISVAGEYLGRHTDSAEEILLVLEGEGIATVGDEDVEIGPGSLAVVPALAPHSVRATGNKVVGFFSGAELEHVFDEPVQPIGLSRLATPLVEVPA